MELQAVVMAAGRGSHMLDLTNSVPKPLIPVANKPLIWYTMTMLEKAGFTEAIVITLNCIKSSVELVLREFNIKSKIVGISENSDLDTVDSLCLIKNDIKSDVLIVSCDLVTDLAFHRISDVHRINDATITMLLCPAKSDIENVPGVKPKKKGQPKQREFIGLSTNKRQNHRVLFLVNEADLESDTLPVSQTILQDFPRVQVRTDLHDSHLYIVKRWLLYYLAHNRSRSSFRSEVIPFVVRKQFSRSAPQLTNANVPDTTKSDVKDIFSFFESDRDKEFIAELSLSAPDKQSSKNHKISCFAYVHDEGTCMNVNNISLVMEANRLVAKPESGFLGSLARVHATAQIEEKTQVGADCLVGERTVLREKCVIKRSQVGKNCVIGSNVRILNCVIMDCVQIASGSSVSGCVLCDDVSIGEGCDLKDCFVGSKKKLPPHSNFAKETLVEREVVMEFE